MRELERDAPSWPFWRFEIADRAAFPSLGVDWQDLPHTHGRYPRASLLRVRLPIETTPAELLDLTTRLVDLFPAQQARAGYLLHVHELSRGPGFDQAWAWARR